MSNGIRKEPTKTSNYSDLVNLVLAKKYTLKWPPVILLICYQRKRKPRINLVRAGATLPFAGALFLLQ